MTHPLTDDLAEKIALKAQWAGDIGDVVFRYDDMRAAYNKGSTDRLEEVIEWLNFGWQTDPNLSREMKQRGGFSKIAIALEKAMRQQYE